MQLLVVAAYLLPGGLLVVAFACKWLVEVEGVLLLNFCVVLYLLDELVSLVAFSIALHRVQARPLVQILVLDLQLSLELVLRGLWLADILVKH